jgi:hypothetical protein
VVINNYRFIDVTNTTTSAPIMTYKEAYAWTLKQKVTTSG